ncbi:MAG TPA: GNAT family N-acetyltransferase [Lacunisphaera sp.]|jgi:RimJ/RimL family protein N-acetyltransferase|nr:GNAT family N-acetyltransferase [Lacunisphaera sp.]
MPPDRITLRQWRDDDLDPYAAMNADPVVMEHFPRPLDRAESAESMARQRALIAERGWGLWVLDVNGAFAGFTGLAVPRFAAPFMPCVEIGWRLRQAFWGRGLALAAAAAALAHGFDRLHLAEIVSFTAASNQRSRRLMERLGFARDAGGDFLHPSLPPESPLRPHVLYRKSRAAPAPVWPAGRLRPAVEIIPP